jgi:hypothetical protein
MRTPDDQDGSGPATKAGKHAVRASQGRAKQEAEEEKKKFREPQPIGVCKFVVWRQGHSEQTWALYVGSGRKPRPR